MKQIIFISIICFFHLASFSQETTIKVKAPKVFTPGGTLRIIIGDYQQGRAIDQSGNVEFKIPFLEAKKNIRIIYSNLGYGTKNWQYTVDLNGSGEASLELSENSVESFQQWPSVTFEAVSSALDIYVNGQVWCTTSCKKGVSPNVDHTVEWKKDGVVKCKKVINLEPNVSRTLKCDANSGQLN